MCIFKLHVKLQEIRTAINSLRRRDVSTWQHLKIKSTDRITHTTAFVIPVVEHRLEREISQSVHHEGSIRRPIAP